VLRRIALFMRERSPLAWTAADTLRDVGPPAIPVLVENLEFRFDEEAGDDAVGVLGMPREVLRESDVPLSPPSSLPSRTHRLGLAPGRPWSVWATRSPTKPYRR
jgi:hypothetical protein